MYCNLHMQNFSYNINIDHLPPMRWYKVHTYKCVKSLKCVPKLTMQYSYWQIFICRICHRNFKDFPYFQNGHYSNCTFQSGTIHLNIVVAFSKSLLFQHFSSPLLHLYTVFIKKITNVPLLSINECKVPKADTKNKYLCIPLLFY